MRIENWQRETVSRNNQRKFERNLAKTVWRRGWDSHHRRLLKTKNLTDSDFLTILKIRTKALVETRIEHATGVVQLKETGVRFAALMRQLTRANGGTFVGLNAYR